MNRLTLKKAACIVLGIALALISGAQSAYATVVQYTYTTPSQLTDLNYNLNVPTFDLSLGTLQKVEISLSSNLTSSVTVTNTGKNPSSGNINGNLDFTLGFTGLGGLVNASQTVDSKIGPDKFSKLAPGGTFVSTPITLTNTVPTATYTAASILAAFTTTGAGSIPINFSTSTYTSLSVGGGSMSMSQSTFADSSVTVSYTYAAMVHAPEPSSMLALLAAIGLYIVPQYLRRRKR